MTISLRNFFTLFFFFALFFLTESFAQVSTQNLATVNVDALTDQQILQISQQAKTSGTTDEQLYSQLRERGMPAGQIDKLSSRLNQLRAKDSRPYADTTRRQLNYVPDSSTYNSNPRSQSLRLPVFGADLFANHNIRFEPNLNLATPVNYIIGPGDQLDISVYGLSQANWKLQVSAEGNINIPGTGIINVAGKSISQATSLIRSKLIASNYTLGRGTNLQVTLGNIRSIKVIIVGQVVKPGTYTLPSLATVFNALYAAGGPNINGSFRKIEVIRNNKVIRRLDVYDFLVSGDQHDNVNLQDQDIIRVPTYEAHVEFSGQVKIPAIFEVLPKETLQDVINFAGGFTDSAYTSRIKVSQIFNQRRRITDIVESEFATYHPSRGDKYIAETIVNRFENRLTLYGAVYRPGVYELEKGLTLSQLIEKAEGLKEDAFMDRGTITRLRPDNTTEIISFNLRDIVNKANDIALQREDIINIASLFDLRDQYQVSINGLVRRPGTYAFAENMKVEDLIFQAGGFAEGASTLRIEVARRIADANPLATNTTIAEVFTVSSNNKLSPEQGNFTLKPFDIISVFSSPGYERQKTVKVEGEVLYPGVYAIKNKSDKISDLIKRVGGLTPFANINGATLRRENSAILGVDKDQIDISEVLQNRKDQLSRLNQSNADTSKNGYIPRNNYVGINLNKIIDNPGSKIDLFLEDNDVLRIPKQEQIVRVNGEVLYPSSVVYVAGKSMRSYIDNAGSFSAYAWQKRPYIVYPNGTVKSTHKFLFFKFYPAVKPGSEIFVPRKPVKVNNALQEVFGVTTGLASLGAIILGIISLRK
jgi:protein involved in polysaccharide export with SLBB domain